MAGKIKRWEIVHEDEHIIVINKPAPYLSIPDRYDNGIPNVKSILQAARPEIYVNHRLDKETSGLMIFTKTKEAHKNLSDQFENRKLTKIYKAIVINTPSEPVGLIELPMSQSDNPRKGMVLNPKGKAAFTKYRILESFTDFTYIDVKLLTGRMHQIRLHMSSINCPIVCDKMYGDGEPMLLSNLKRKYRRSGEVERPLLNRTALHASELEFNHPHTGEQVKLTVDIPKDMKAVLYQLRKHQAIA